MERKTSIASASIRASAIAVAPARPAACAARTLGGLRAASVVALCLALIPAAMAAEIAYVGFWACADTPKLNIPSLSVSASAVRDGDRLTVSRRVDKPGTFEEVARASGTATIQDGRVIIEIATPAGGITGRFEGTVSDAEIRLKGVERVKIPDRGEGERACNAMLNRR
jgi:hypothetical protein